MYNDSIDVCRIAQMCNKHTDVTSATIQAHTVYSRAWRGECTYNYGLMTGHSTSSVYK